MKCVACSAEARKARASRQRWWRAFTLIELLVVISIIALLIAILVPALSRARKAALLSQCLSNHKQQGIGIYAYANDNKGEIPLSPDMPGHVGQVPVTPDLYTNQLFAAEPDPADSRYTGIGRLLDGYLLDNRASFCPDLTRDDFLRTAIDNLRILNQDAFTPYLYRNRFATTDSSIDGLGVNTQNKPAKALLYDFNQADLSAVGAGADSLLHDGKTINALFIDGHAASFDNADGFYTWSILDPPDTQTARTLASYEMLDEEG